MFTNTTNMTASLWSLPDNITSTLLSINARDIFDIIIVAICIYLVLIFIKQTRSNFIFSAIVILFGINFISQEFDLALTRRIFEPLLTFFIAIFVVVFQPEIRKFFKWFSAGRKTTFAKALSLPEENAQTIVNSVFDMAKQRIGAIIVLPGQIPFIHDPLLQEARKEFLDVPVPGSRIQSEYPEQIIGNRFFGSISAFRQQPVQLGIHIFPINGQIGKPGEVVYTAGPV
jgi:DNA integrity scanning protein DisA with diadenylate cyclase activity